MNSMITALLQQLLQVLLDILHKNFDPVPAPKLCEKCSAAEGKLEKLYSKREVIAYLRISSSTYDRYKAQGILAVQKVGRKNYVSAAALKVAMQESIRKGRI